MDPSSLSIDEFGPLSVRRPASVAELCDLVKEAAASGRGLYPVGGRSALDVGLPPTKPGFAVDTTALNQIIDYPARDMTVTVQAGVTLAKLQDVLAAEHQWLPVDVPQPEASTLGAAVALNQSGPHRYGYGTLRDFVIGISFITDEGVEVKAGGRVVKNVAGYDLMKLQIGAVGTLGVVTQLTLKVKPKPESSAAVVLGCDTPALGSVLDLLHASKARPAIVELLNHDAWRDAGNSPSVSAGWVLAVGLEEKATTVEWQMSTLLDELKAAPVRDVTTLRGPAVGSLWQTLTNLQSRPQSRLIWKANVLPSRVPQLVTAMAAVTPYLVHAEALNGIVWFHAPEGFPEDTDDPKLPWLEQQITQAGGNSVLRRCPTDWKHTLRVWGHPPDAWNLMRHVKQTLDPQDVFNPGRLFGDLSRV